MTGFAFAYALMRVCGGQPRKNPGAPIRVTWITMCERTLKPFFFRSYKKRDITMNPQYEILAKCLLPTHMLEWFELTNVEVKPKENTVTQDTQSEENPVKVGNSYDEISLYYISP